MEAKEGLNLGAKRPKEEAEQMGEAILVLAFLQRQEDLSLKDLKQP